MSSGSSNESLVVPLICLHNILKKILIHFKYQKSIYFKNKV